jgi:hypothetical protein
MDAWSQEQRVGEKEMADQNVPDGFRTRAGLCTILPEEIAFTRLGDQAARGSSRATWIPVLFASLLFGFGIFLFLFGDTMMGAIFVILGLGLRWQQVRGNSTAPAPNIPRQAIRKVEVRAPLLFMPGEFVVLYEAGGKTFRQRIVVQGGTDEYARALSVLRAAGLLPG